MSRKKAKKVATNNAANCDDGKIAVLEISPDDLKTLKPLADIRGFDRRNCIGVDIRIMEPEESAQKKQKKMSLKERKAEADRIDEEMKKKRTVEIQEKLKKRELSTGDINCLKLLYEQLKDLFHMAMHRAEEYPITRFELRCPQIATLRLWDFWRKTESKNERENKEEPNPWNLDRWLKTQNIGNLYSFLIEVHDLYFTIRLLKRIPNKRKPAKLVHPIERKIVRRNDFKIILPEDSRAQGATLFNPGECITAKPKEKT